MLIKLTDQCQMMCPHCMEDAKPKGRMMSIETFKNAVRFATHIGCMHQVLSGGEPTENGLILSMCAWLDSVNPAGGFAIVSNGMWLKDEYKKAQIELITRIPSFICMQVYSNKKWYKEYDYVAEHKDEYEKYRGVIVDLDEKIYMQELGRARFDAEAQKEVMANHHFMSCINAVLVAKQVEEPVGYGISMLLRHKFCNPSVDCEGFVHMSESRLCPSAGNVNTDSFDDIWNNMRAFKPCGKCHQYQTFINSDTPKAVLAKQIIGL